MLHNKMHAVRVRLSPSCGSLTWLRRRLYEYNGAKPERLHLVSLYFGTSTGTMILVHLFHDRVIYPLLSLWLQASIKRMIPAATRNQLCVHFHATSPPATTRVSGHGSEQKNQQNQQNENTKTPVGQPLVGLLAKFNGYIINFC
jgi:hypothetical protein